MSETNQTSLDECRAAVVMLKREADLIDGVIHIPRDAWNQFMTRVDVATEKPIELNPLLKGLVSLIKESSQSKWQVILDYDNYHDGARVLDGDGKVIGECYDAFFPTPEDEAGVERQFIEAVRRAMEATK